MAGGGVAVIDLSHDAAQAIVAEARSMGVKVDYGPDTVIQVAERLIESAREAHKQGVRGDHVTRILHMAEGGEIAVEQNNAVQQEQLTQEQEKLALSSRPGYEASDAAPARRLINLSRRKGKLLRIFCGFHE